MPLFRRISYLIFLLSIIFISTSYSQEISSAELKLMSLLNSNSSYIPKDLLSTKTVVVLSLDDKTGSGIRGDWQGLAKEAHFYISKLGIDPVTYYYVDDLISGYDVKKAVTAEMVKREIKNVLMLSKDKINGRDQFIGVITEFDQKSTFVSHNQNAWKSQTSDLEILFRNMARSIDNADLIKENFLFLDSPEFFRGVRILKGRRMESFNTDLRIDRIAIPIFEDLPLPEGSGSANQSMIESIQKGNEEILRKNAQLEQVMANYPYEFKLLPYQYDEQMLLTQGCQFVLMSITSSGRNVRKLLGYEVSEQVSELITMKKDDTGNIQVKAIPIDGLVTKYYIKHINSGEIFLGEQWDGDDNWLDALKNHLNQLLEKLEKKKN